MRRQERGRRKVKRLSKSKHITCKKVNKGGLFCLNGSQGESGGSQDCLQYKMHGQWIGFLKPCHSATAVRWLRLRAKTV